jgi:hypothetical protein
LKAVQRRPDGRSAIHAAWHDRNEFGAPEPGETATAMEGKLRFHTASWNLSVDLKTGLAVIVGSMRAAAIRTSPATSPMRSASHIAK